MTKFLVSFFISLCLSYIIVLYNRNIFSDSILIQIIAFFISSFLLYVYIEIFLFKNKSEKKITKVAFIFYLFYLLFYPIYYLFFDDRIVKYLGMQTSILETLVYSFFISVVLFSLVYFILNIEKIFSMLYILSLNLNKILVVFFKYAIIPILVYFFVMPSIIRTDMRITGHSMQQTLQDGDIPLISTFGLNTTIPFTTEKLTFGLNFINRGDIVNIDPHNSKYRIESGHKGDKYFTKRVIGLPGERIKIVNDKVYINNKLLNESYAYFDIKKQESLSQTNKLLKKTSRIHCSLYDCKEFTLKSNEYFLMGDNRWGSMDSRSFGPVPAYLIYAKLLFVILSYDKDKLNYNRSMKSYW